MREFFFSFFHLFFIFHCTLFSFLMFSLCLFFLFSGSLPVFCLFISVSGLLLVCACMLIYRDGFLCFHVVSFGVVLLIPSLFLFGLGPHIEDNVVLRVGAYLYISDSLFV